MKILLIGPHENKGSLPPYLDVLAEGLRAHGAEVDRLGAPGVPYDTENNRFRSAESIIDEARTLLEQVDLTRYDVLSVHFGNLEVEQLLPTLWAGQPRPPAVYHVHSLAWTLFEKHVPSPGLRAKVSEGIRAMDGFLCFGTYGMETIAGLGRPGTPARVSFLPTTITDGTPVPPRTAPAPGAPLRASLYGFPAPWKNVPGLLEAFRLMRHPMVFTLAGGPGWLDPAQTGANLRPGSTRYGPVELIVRDQYMGVADRVALVAEADLAVFPYQPIETFQGTGALADYARHEVPVLATDVANMAELVGPAGQIVPPGDPAALAAGMDRFISDPTHRAALNKAAATRAERFSPLNHAATCLAFYREVMNRT